MLELVFSLVEHSARQVLEDALARDNPWHDHQARGAQRKRRRTTAHHVSTLVALFSHRAYSMSACLVVDTSYALRLLRHESARSPTRSLLGLLAGWESAVLLVGIDERSRLVELWTSPTARRCAVLLRDQLSVQALQLAIVHAHSQSAQIPAIVAGVSAPFEQSLALLRREERAVLSRVLAEPHLWHVDRVAAAFGVTRRSLERRMTQVGLPSPAAFLHLTKGAMSRGSG